MDICSGATLTSETGFIKSPNYPFNYPANTKCTSYIRVHRTQQLKLYVFDFKLQSVNWTSGRCSDDLYIQTGTQSDTHCGDHKPLRHQPLTRTLRNEITLTFESNDSVQKKGFWLYYEGIFLRLLLALFILFKYNNFIIFLLFRLFNNFNFNLLYVNSSQADNVSPF